MSLASANKNYFNFSGGFNTDASPLNLPENTSVDEANFPLRLDGERHRRKGMDYEANYVQASQVIDDSDAVNTYQWHNVANDEQINFVVCQTGSTLHFYDKQGDSYSGNKKAFTVDLLTRKVSGASDTSVKQSPVQGIQGKGLFFVTGKYIEPFYISYDKTSDTISLTRIFISARDFKGSEENVGIANRPTVLTQAHTYDLYNQGWTDSRINSFYSSLGVYPSNVDRWEYGVYTDYTTGKETFDPSQMDLQNLGNTPAAKGHFITASIFDTTQSTDASKLFSIDSFTYSSGTVTITTVETHGLATNDNVVIQNNQFTYDNGAGCGSPVQGSLDGTYTVTVTGSKTFTISKTLTGFVAWCDQYVSKGYVLGDTITNPNGFQVSVRPEAIGFYAGRAWYGGVAAEELGGKIFFSQIAQEDIRLGQCYQEADPTSEEISDLLPTDGGVITIPEMGQLLAFRALANIFILFADNGVWSIEPGDKGYFTADSYSIRKVTDVGAVSSRSVVEAEGAVFYLAAGGIYVLMPDKVSGSLEAKSVSSNRIDEHLKTVPVQNKKYVKGMYDQINKEIRWIYGTQSSKLNTYDRELIFNIVHGAFTKMHIDTSLGVYVCDIQPLLTSKIGVNDVAAKYLSHDSNGNTITFAGYTNTNFKDWEAFDSTGVDAEAYIITAYELLDDAMRRKFANYVFCYFQRTEDTAVADANGDFNLTTRSGCLMRSRWDWADNQVSGKWGKQWQVYRFKKYFQPSSAGAFDNGLPVVVTKNKVRGSGKVLSLEFRTEQGKDCRFLGWAVAFNGVTDE